MEGCPTEIPETCLNADIERDTANVSHSHETKRINFLSTEHTLLTFSTLIMLQK